MTKLEKIEQKIKKLPPKVLDKVEVFIDSISRRKLSKRKMKLECGGILKELKDKYTSVELQHRVSDWIVEDTAKGKHN
jgi:hypothetical protein